MLNSPFLGNLRFVHQFSAHFELWNQPWIHEEVCQVGYLKPIGVVDCLSGAIDGMCPLFIASENTSK